MPRLKFIAGDLCWVLSLATVFWQTNICKQQGNVLYVAWKVKVSCMLSSNAIVFMKYGGTWGWDIQLILHAQLTGKDRQYSQSYYWIIQHRRRSSLTFFRRISLPQPPSMFGGSVGRQPMVRKFNFPFVLLKLSLHLLQTSQGRRRKLVLQLFDMGGLDQRSSM